MAAPVDAGAAGVRGHAPAPVDDVELPMLAAGISLRQHSDNFVGRRALRQQQKSRLGIERVDECLRRQRADAASCVRAQDADREKTARNGDAESATGVAGKERPGHRRMATADG